MNLAVPIMDREELRRSFRPKKIKILFVGESPPANGAFFYVYSPMTKYMAQVFAQVRGEGFRSLADFLKFFKAKGCYLDDLSHEPVDDLSRPERLEVIESCIDVFSERLREFQPKHVIAVLKRIEAPVREAVQRTGLRVPFDVVPFPGHGHQPRFVDELSKILKPLHGPGV
jgi:hypothetical protein